MFSLAMTYNLLKQMSLLIPLLLISSLSPAVAPIEANFILGMDVQGQRLNLYRGCGEGQLTCDDMLLIAPDLDRLLQSKLSNSAQNTAPYAIKLYSASTIHSTCKDGVTPCRFRGYGFNDDHVDGFIDTSDNTIHLKQIRYKGAADETLLPYTESKDYLPLTANSLYIDDKYQQSDNQLNVSYRGIQDEVMNFYGSDMVAELRQDQLRWIKQRSRHCGADAKHEPRTQAEKVCFIQQNRTRMEEYFLWID